jgi:cytochrome c biogenesis protein CcmG/thiol:disulfide interchange protein DsbE
MTCATRKQSYILNWRVVLAGSAVSLLVLFAVGLTRDPSYLPSALIGREVPGFSLPMLTKTGLVKTEDYLGKPFIINFWASWCTSCRQEHDELIWLGSKANNTKEFVMVGVNSRDTNNNALQFLSTQGQFPYSSGIDPRGRTSIDFGVYGMPETFFVDKDGIVQWRHTGPLNRQVLQEILPKIGVKP